MSREMENASSAGTKEKENVAWEWKNAMDGWNSWKTNCLEMPSKEKLGRMKGKKS